MSQEKNVENLRAFFQTWDPRGNGRGARVCPCSILRSSMRRTSCAEPREDARPGRGQVRPAIAFS